MIGGGCKLQGPVYGLLVVVVAGTDVSLLQLPMPRLPAHERRLEVVPCPTRRCWAAGCCCACCGGQSDGSAGRCPCHRRADAVDVAADPRLWRTCCALGPAGQAGHPFTGGGGGGGQLLAVTQAPQEVLVY